jgi:transposase
MDDSLLSRFFLEPSSARQRQYEALRAVFVEGLSQKEAAERFSYSYDAFRQLVHEFRQSVHDGQTPPFSSTRAAADHRPNRA